MSKINIKKPKFHGRCDKFWINKVRLYLTLHGITICDPHCDICKHLEKLGRHSYRCKKLFREGRWFIKKDLSNIKKGYDDEIILLNPLCFEEEYFCMEWIINV